MEAPPIMPHMCPTPWLCVALCVRPYYHGCVLLCVSGPITHHGRLEARASLAPRLLGNSKPTFCSAILTAACISVYHVTELPDESLVSVIRPDASLRACVLTEGVQRWSFRWTGLLLSTDTGRRWHLDGFHDAILSWEFISCKEPLSTSESTAQTKGRII